MARYIDADKIVPDAIQERKFVIQIHDALHSSDILIRTAYADLADFIAAQPTVDVVEVVRCGECTKRYTTDCSCWYGIQNDTSFWAGATFRDDFGCTDGKKKGSNNEK